MSVTDQQCVAEMVSVAGALEYWRRGEFEEALAIIRTAREKQPARQCETACVEAMILVDMGELAKAWALVSGECPDDAPLLVKGKYHGTRGHVLSRLGKVEESIISHVEAQCWFDLAEHPTHSASSKTNLARLYAENGNFAAAHENLDIARSAFVKLGDSDKLGKNEDQRAAIYLMEGRLDRAEASARTAVDILSKGGRVTWLAEALRTLAIVMARKRQVKESAALFQRALHLCEGVEAVEGVGLTCLTMLEELPMDYRETLDLHARAERFWDKPRLARARSKLIAKINNASEIDTVKYALQKHDGSVTKAAAELGLKTHGWIIALIKKHPELSLYRKPKRKKTIIRK